MNPEGIFVCRMLDGNGDEGSFLGHLMLVSLYLGGLSLKSHYPLSVGLWSISDDPEKYLSPAALVTADIAAI